MTDKHAKDWYYTILPLQMCTYTSNAVNSPLQACTPSVHVCSNLESLPSPQFLNQEPPAAQQVRVPVFLMVPHTGQAVSVLAGIGGGGAAAIFGV